MCMKSTEYRAIHGQGSRGIQDAAGLTEVGGGGAIVSFHSGYIVQSRQGNRVDSTQIGK